MNDALLAAMSAPMGTRFAFPVLASLCSLSIGMLVAIGNVTIPLMLVGVLVVVVAVDRLSLFGWCFLILAASVMSRALVAFLDLPAVFAFLHYPLVSLFALITMLRRRPTASQRIERSTTCWLLGLVFISVLSMIVNGTYVIRTLLFLLILTQPLLLLWAIPRWKDQVKSALPRLVRFAGVAVLVQVVLAGGQLILLGKGDFIQGTLVNHGAGAHVLGADLGLVVLIVISSAMASRTSWSVALMGSTLLVALMIAADAKQVIGCMLLALILMMLVSGRELSTVIGKRLLSRSAAAIAILLVIIGSITFVESTAPGTLERSRNLVSGYEVAEVAFAKDQVTSSPLNFLLGYGPGTTASRASLLLTPGVQKEDSPVAALDLPPTQLGAGIAAQTRSPFGGSVESLSSSTLGLLGDIGIAGLLGLAVIVTRVLLHLVRGRTTLRLAALGAVAMTVPLAFIDSWLEYPEYMVPFGILLGLALGEASSLSVEGPALNTRRSLSRRP